MYMKRKRKFWGKINEREDGESWDQLLKKRKWLMMQDRLTGEAWTKT